MRATGLLKTAAVLVLAVSAGLLTLGAFARGRGVHRVPLPPGSLIATFSAHADYVDSYAAPVPASLFPDTRALDRYAFQRSAVAGEGAEEIVYRGDSSRLVYHVSYLCRSEGDGARLFVSTTVHYRSWRGRVYFACVRPFHRALTPFMVAVMIRQAQKGRT